MTDSVPCKKKCGNKTSHHSDVCRACRATVCRKCQKPLSRSRTLITKTQNICKPCKLKLYRQTEASSASITVHVIL